MTDESDRRTRYLEDRERAVQALEDKAFEYEKQAVRYSNSTFKVLSYLNGGALVAIPAVVSLFKTDLPTHRISLLLAAAFFIFGLLSIVLSQGFAFFTMARRSEGLTLLAYEQQTHLALTHYPDKYDPKKLRDDATNFRSQSDVKMSASNTVRRIALIFVWLSVTAFIVGCGLGAYAVLS